MTTPGFLFEGRALRRARLRRHMTQKELEKAAGVNYTTISRLEVGERQTAYMRTIKKLAAALDIDPDDLIIYLDEARS